MDGSRSGIKSDPNSPTHSRRSNTEHEEDTDAEDKHGSGLRKKRIQQACRPCGVKRVKCDGSMPCVTCVKAGEQCQYGQPKKRGPPKGSTRGGSKASKRAAAVPVATGPDRRNVYDASLVMPIHQNTSTFGSAYNVGNSALPPPPPLDNRQWPRPSLGPGLASSSRDMPASAIDFHALDTHAEPYAAYPGGLPETNLRGESYRGEFRSHRDSHPRHHSTDSSEAFLQRQGPDSFYRGGSSGHSFIRPASFMGSSSAGGERRLPALDFRAGRTTSAGSSPGRSDYHDIKRSGSRSSQLYRRSSPSPSSAAAPGTDFLARDYHRAAASYQSSATSPFGSMQQQLQAQSAYSPWTSAPGSGSSLAGQLPRPLRSGGNSDNPLLVEGTLLQMHKDQTRKPSLATSETGEDPVLDPLLWVEPESAGSSSFERSGITLTQPAIPLLIQERLFTIFWGIVQTIWPALYKPALRLTGFNIIDPKQHPMLHNAACALAAAAWDSGEAGLSEQDTEATQSDWVERTASDLSFSQGNVDAGANPQRLSAANLGDIFLVRAKYYLVKINNEPSLEAIQSLLFMALREGGNGRASQASAYQTTACRMAIDLGLHRQRDFSSVLGLNLSHAEEQARSRIFWCLYLLDKTSSAALGRPVILRDMEIDCPLPSINEADEEETWAQTTNNSSLIRDNARNTLLKAPVAAMTHLRSGIRLGQICERIIGMYTEVKARADSEDSWDVKVAQIHQSLQDWETQLAPPLRFEEPARRLPSTLSQHLWFQVCKVILHRPYILKTSTKPGMPSSLQVCTEACGKICDILTAYEDNFGMRKLSSTFTYCIFTASTIAIANTTSTDRAVAAEAKRLLTKFMTWLGRISGSWKSATHHLQILEQLGHGIDADMDGTGLPSRGSDLMSVDSTRRNSATGKIDRLETYSVDQEPKVPPFAPINAIGQPLLNQGGQSVPGPIGAPLNLGRSRSSFTVGPAMQDDLHAQFQAQGQNPGQLFGYPATGSVSLQRPSTTGIDTSTDNSADAVAAAAATFGDVSMHNLPASTARQPMISPGASLKVHDTSYWGAMPLASEDTLSWANFTNSYLEAVNGLAVSHVLPQDISTGTGTGTDLDLAASAYGSADLGIDTGLAARIDVAMTRPQTALEHQSGL